MIKKTWERCDERGGREDHVIFKPNRIHQAYCLTLVFSVEHLTWMLH